MEEKNTTDLVLRKSNSLISGKYKTSLLENKIMAIALTRITIIDGCPVATLYPGEIKKILGKENDTNIYRTLKRTAKIMTGHNLIIESGTGEFRAFSMINNADYIDKKFTITFNKNLTPYVHNLKNNFTTMEVAVLMKFKKGYSYRIYELLKKEIYKSKPDVNNGIVIKEYGLNELRCTIGLANTDEEGVKKAIADGKSWDYIYENVIKEKQFPVWYDFKRKVLEPAREELAQTSDIRFNYEADRYGTGGKIRRIRFFIEKNNPEEYVYENVANTAKLIRESNKEYQQITMDDFVEITDDETELDSYIGMNGLTRDHLIEFVRLADGDEEKVIRAIKKANEQPELRNYIGWIISCIKRNGYEDPIPVIQGSTEKGEKVKALKEFYKNNKNDIAEKVWQKIKSRSDYQDFISYMAANGIKESSIEVIYDAGERADLYTEWKIHVANN